VCKKPFAGPACASREVVHGKCDAKGCVCERGWGGDGCDVRVCPNDCSGRGKCIDGRCFCPPGPADSPGSSYAGIDCGSLLCPNVCEHGTRGANGTSCGCTCSHGWAGPACNEPICPLGCSGHGGCDMATGVCTCDRGWDGSGCNVQPCPGGCSGVGGVCLDGKCRCSAGRGGLDCSLRLCINDCSGHGQCDTSTGECACEYGWSGAACSVRECLNGCSQRGHCTPEGTCACFDGLEGADCSKVPPMLDESACHPSGPTPCLNGGRCEGARCMCPAGTSGYHCEAKGCPAGCSMHGVCNTTSGACACDGGWEGAGCERESHSCSDHGVYNASLDGPSKCKCDSGWEGPGCGKLSCPFDCSGIGTCVGSGTATGCLCPLGFTGRGCEVRPAPGRVLRSHGRHLQRASLARGCRDQLPSAEVYVAWL